MRKIWPLFLVLLVALGCGGCSHDEDPVLSSSGSDLRLLLRIFTAETGDGKTRASTYDFEYPTLDSEKLQTIRVIIVDGSDSDYGRIVHNHYETLWKAVEDYRTIMPLDVEFNTRYKIYLIGNESGIKGYSDGIRQFLISDLAQGNVYPENALEDMILDLEKPGNPMLINDSEADALPIPMTEMYEITTMERPECVAEDNVYTEERSFFLTRAVTKFSFNLKRGQISESANISSVKYVKISGLSKKEYLFPRETVYHPLKVIDGKLNSGNELRRYITSFTLPSDNTVGEYVFELPDRIMIDELPEEGYSFAPTIYFPESTGQILGESNCFTCSLSADGVHFIETRTLDNLDLMPRNTYVKVNIKVNAYDIDASVDVLPYKPVDLRPEFGIDRD